MVIYEADVPGVAKRYEVKTGDDERLVVIVHHDCNRELYRLPHLDADAEKLFVPYSRSTNTTLSWVSV